MVQTLHQKLAELSIITKQDEQFGYIITRIVVIAVTNQQTCQRTKVLIHLYESSDCLNHAGEITRPAW